MPCDRVVGCCDHERAACRRDGTEREHPIDGCAEDAQRSRHRQQVIASVPARDDGILVRPGQMRDGLAWLAC
jgi:hypothetical protein